MAQSRPFEPNKHVVVCLTCNTPAARDGPHRPLFEIIWLLAGSGCHWQQARSERTLRAARVQPDPSVLLLWFL